MKTVKLITNLSTIFIYQCLICVKLNFQATNIHDLFCSRVGVTAGAQSLMNENEHKLKEMSELRNTPGVSSFLLQHVVWEDWMPASLTSLR